MTITTTQQAIILKADFVPFTILQMNDTDLENLQLQLEKKIEQAPLYFNQAPVIIDVTHLIEKSTLNLPQLCKTLKSLHIIPVGIRGLLKNQHRAAIKEGLSLFNTTSGHAAHSKKPAKSNNSTDQKQQITITKPVRAGSQVYAQGGDLTITAAVNTGAECIADGNIHIYGPLRGKAIAGAQGNEQARIFCQKLDAELICIAGHYLVREHFDIPKTKKPMLQIYLSDNKLKIEGI